MGEVIKLTEDWVTVTNGGTQPLYAALDVLPFDQLDFMLYTGLDSPGSPTFTLTLLTAPSLLSTSGWTAIATPAPIQIINDRTVTTKLIGPLTGGFMRYVRWGVSLTNITTARFYIEGVGRKTR